MKNIKYQVTKKQCQEKIDMLNNVCNKCGRRIKPLKTVNNSGEPTYWSGCMHGQVGKGAWGDFTQGVSKETYDLAIKLVLEDGSSFHMKDIHLGDFNFSFQNAVYSACNIISQIEWMKNNKPRFTKKQLEKKYFNKIYDK